MKCYWLSGWRSHILGRVELGLLSRRNTLLYPEHNNNDSIVNQKEKEVTKKNGQPITNISAFKEFRGNSPRGNIKHMVKKANPQKVHILFSRMRDLEVYMPKLS